MIPAILSGSPCPTHNILPPTASHPEVLRAALSAALQKLMARGAPDWARVALVVRQMAGAAAGDDDRTAVFE